MPLAGQEGHSRKKGEEGLELSPTTSAEHSTVSWPNCNSICSTWPTTLGMGRERSPQSMTDTSSSLWDTRGVIASSGRKPGLLTDSSSSRSQWEQAHKRGNLFHTVCLEADSRNKTSSPAASWAALPCSTCRQNCPALPPSLASAHNFASKSSDAFPCSPPSASSPQQPCAHAKLPEIITGAGNPECLGSCHSFSFSYPSFHTMQRLTPAALNTSWR